MGNQHSQNEFHYSVAVEPSHDANSTAIYRASTHPSDLISGFANCEVDSAWDIFQMTVDKFPDRPFLGKRYRQPQTGELGEYEWMSYSEGKKIALKLGTALQKLRYMHEAEFPEEVYAPARRMKILGLYSKNCVEWFLAEQACNAYGFTLCPLYDTLGEESMEHVLKVTKMKTILVSFECFDELIRVITESPSEDEENAAPRLKSDVVLEAIVLINPETDDRGTIKQMYMDAAEKGKPLGLTVALWNEVLSFGTETLTPTPATREQINTLCFTSGTTGLPKGVLIPHNTVVAVTIGAIRGPINPTGIFEVGPGDCVISYLPLAHVFERCVCNIVICVGGAIGLYSGDMAKLLDDIKVLKPSVFVSVPRLFNRINDKIAMTLQEKTPPMQALFNQGLNSKINRRRNIAVTTHRLWDAVAFAKFREMMGGRLRGMICGGAPLDPVICERMTAFFAVPLMQGYGLSETFGPCFLMNPKDCMAGPVGGVWPSVEYKVVSVPELNYLVSDSPPRGELCLRGPGITVGYFLNTEATNAAWDPDGWFHTGDVVTLVTATGAVQIIDRKKNIFKLSQGEYVAPEKIEAIYGQSTFVSQIFVFGYSDKTCLVGVVVPELELAQKWAAKNNYPNDADHLIQNAAFKKVVMADLDAVAVKNKLKGFEKVREIHLTKEAFTVENDLLTPTSKLRRNECRLAYAHQINEMYEKLGQ